MNRKVWVLLLGIVLAAFTTEIVSAEGVQKTSKVRVEIKKGEGYVDLTIDEIKEENYIIEKTLEGRYLVTMIGNLGTFELQYVTQEEAKSLGYVEDIVSRDVIKDKDITIEKTEDGRYVVIITDKEGVEVKQYVTQEEAKSLGYIEDIINSENIKDIEVERLEDGKYVAIINLEDGRYIRQVITEEEAIQLGYGQSEEGKIGKESKEEVKGMVGKVGENKGKNKEGEDSKKDVTEEDTEEDTGEGEVTDVVTIAGIKLPDTFTGMYNWIIIGGVLTLLGFTIVVARKKIRGDLGGK